MAYQAPRKKKEWWETALESVGRFADKIIPGDQSSWHTPSKPSTPSRPQQVTPTVRNNPVQIFQNNPTQNNPTQNNSPFGQKPLTFGSLDLDKPLTLGTTKPQEVKPIVSPLNTKAIDERLDKGYSWEQISKETGSDLNRVKQYSQKTRPGYGIAPKPVQPKQTFTDFKMENGKNKEILGVDVGQFMGKAGKTYDMKVGGKTELAKDDFLKGFDNVSKTSKQVRNTYVNKLRDMAESGDTNAQFTLKTLEDSGKLKGNWTDTIASANEEFLGGVIRSGARAIEYLPGEQGTGKWADRQEKLRQGATDRDKLGENIGKGQRIGLDIGTMVTPAGIVDKAVKGTKVVRGLSQGGKAARAAGYGARIIPGSSVFAGGDIASQHLQGEDPDIARSAAIGIGADLALPVAGRVISKIPGVKTGLEATGGAIVAGANRISQGITEGASIVRNEVDQTLDSLIERYQPKTPSVTISTENIPTPEVTPNTPRSDTKPFNPEIQPETQQGITDLINRSEATPVPQGSQRVFQSNGANGEKTNWVFDDVDSLLAYKNNTTNPGDTFEFIDVPQGSLKRTGNGEHVFTIGDSPLPKEYARVDKRAIDPNDTMARLRERAANPTAVNPIDEWKTFYNLKDDTVARLERDYGTEKALRIFERNKDASNVNDWNGFLVSQAQKQYGKVAPTGKVKINQAVPEQRVISDEELAAMEAAEFGNPNTVKIGNTSDAEERLLANKLDEEQRVQDYRDQNSVLTDQQERQLNETQFAPANIPQQVVNPTTPNPVREVENLPPVGAPEAPLGKMTETFYENKQGNQKIRFKDLENLGKQVSQEADTQFKAIGSDFTNVARTVEEANRNGIRNLDEVNLSDAEKQLWRNVEAEMDYVRRRASLGKRDIGKGDFGETYVPNVSKEEIVTHDTLFEGFRQNKPGNEIKRMGAMEIDELTFDPSIIGNYITRYGDTKLLQEERIYRAMVKNNPDVLDERVIRDAAQSVINIQNKVNNLKTKITLGGVGKKVTINEGKVVDFADEMNKVGKQLGKDQIQVTATPRGLTNGDRINSVTIDDGGQAVTVADYLGLNQVRDSGAYAGTQAIRANGDKEVLADMVAERLNNNYKLPQEDVDYAVQSILNMKPDLPTEVVAARLTGIYRNAGKSQLLERLQQVNIQNKTLRNDISALSNQILREGSIEQELSAKVVQGTLRAQNALFRKLNVSSALNELSDMTSFFTIYGKDLKVFTPDFQLVKQLGLGELDPALEPFLKQVDDGVPINKVLDGLKKLNDGTRFYKFVETYKAGVMAKTARDFYSQPKNGGLVGDELTAKILEDYRNFALPVDAFTKTFLDNYPLYTQYMTWGARNLQKEGRLLTGQFDAGVMKDKSTGARIARDLYANIPAKTVFWLSSNGLKGTSIMTAFGLTDFTGLTNQDYSGIQEEDKTWYDKTTQWTNMSTTLSLLNTSIQALEKEQLKQKYADADYNPYENASFGESLINTYTPQFLKNALGANDLQQRGYSDANNSVADQVSRLFGGKPEEGRVQYEAPDDPWNTFKSFVFGKNQTENAREYSGRENLADRMAEGVNPFQAVSDMAQEQMGVKEADYNRPLSEDYSEKYKSLEDADRTALLDGGRRYNKLLDDLKKNNPDLYNNYVSSMKDHVSPEMWRARSMGEDGKVDLTTFKMIGDRKKQLAKDLGTPYDPLYDLPDDQAAAVLRYKSTPTGEDIAVRNMLNKEQWYKDLKARQAEFYDKQQPADDSEYKNTERVKQWNGLEDQLNSFYYDAESIAKDGAPAWAEQFPTVFQQKQINDQFGFGSQESKNFFRSYGDQYRAEKEGYDRAQLDIINQMRAIEGYPPMSWEGYQQATEFADTDGDSDSKSGWKNNGKSGGGGSSKSDISPNAGGSYSSVGNSTGAKSIKITKAPTVKLVKRGGGAKKIAIKRGGKTK